MVAWDLAAATEWQLQRTTREILAVVGDCNAIKPIKPLLYNFTTCYNERYFPNGNINTVITNVKQTCNITFNYQYCALIMNVT